jgi:hypothetical protein
MNPENLVIFNPDGPCMCPSPAEVLDAALQGAELEPRCDLHQRAEIRARERQEARAALGERAVLVEYARRKLDPALDGPVEDEQPDCECDGLRNVTALLAGREVPPCPLHRPTLTDTPPLGSDALLHTRAPRRRPCRRRPSAPAAA